MKKLIGLSLLFVLIGTACLARNSNESDELLGKWKYQVESAPYGYEAGTLVFSASEGKLLGKVLLAENNKIDLQNVSYAEGELKFGLYVDYDYITIKAKIQGDKLEGTVNSPEGPMKITAKKIIKE
ncbi:hypothetical protein [Maribellus mangrovi]|uniref:hypothetical protein n=1 Tax=Maribellus mangrovi TaxID=3133146 RepID=UPI0030EE97AC